MQEIETRSIRIRSGKLCIPFPVDATGFMIVHFVREDRLTLTREGYRFECDAGFPEGMHDILFDAAGIEAGHVFMEVIERSGQAPAETFFVAVARRDEHIFLEAWPTADEAESRSVALIKKLH